MSFLQKFKLFISIALSVTSGAIGLNVTKRMNRNKTFGSIRSDTTTTNGTGVRGPGVSIGAITRLH